MWAHNRFVTSSFDGAVRVWDARRFLPVLVLPVAVAAPHRYGRDAEAERRLARVDVWHDCIAAGGMDGRLHLWDCEPGRPEMLV